jgi:hypothetical protein
MMDSKITDKFSSRMVSKKEAATRQIGVAIRLFFEGEFESAITLACAAEGQLGEGDESHLLALLRERMPPHFENVQSWISCLNRSRDWLKHPTPQLGDIREMDGCEAYVMLVRAVSKFRAVYPEETENMKTMNEFIEWGRVSGLMGQV